MVSHDILEQKLYHYRVRGLVNNVLKSYLILDKQLIVQYINGSCSKTI